MTKNVNVHFFCVNFLPYFLTRLFLFSISHEESLLACCSMPGCCCILLTIRHKKRGNRCHSQVLKVNQTKENTLKEQCHTVPRPESPQGTLNYLKGRRAQGNCFVVQREKRNFSSLCCCIHLQALHRCCSRLVGEPQRCFEHAYLNCVKKNKKNWGADSKNITITCKLAQAQRRVEKGKAKQRKQIQS